MGLLSPPAVMRLLSWRIYGRQVSRAAVGHKLDRTSRVTCREPDAVSRATEICGLFFKASASACFSDRDICVPGLAWDVGNRSVAHSEQCLESV